IEIGFSGAPSLKSPKLSETGKQKLVSELAAASEVSLPKEEIKLGRWTRNTERMLAKKPDPSGFLFASKEAFNVKISEPQRERVVRILSALETALSAAGMEWEVDPKSHYVVGKMYGELISFEIFERYTRTEHIEKHPTHSWLDKKTYSYRFVGDLTIRIEGWYEGRKSWSDGKTQRLEAKIPVVIEGFLAAAEALRQRTLDREEQHRKWAEEAKRREERERIAREEKAFLDQTIKEANDWKQANTISQYAAYLRELVSKHQIELTEAGEQWLSRVEDSANKLNPALKRLCI
ncbi:MAG: hypothetical protein WCL27_09450, partial [Betaproteobacteria bacterium]